METVVIKNNQSIPLASIPVSEYERFLLVNTSLVKEPAYHCVSYYGVEEQEKLRLICCMADDDHGTIHVSSSLVDKQAALPSFTANHLSFEKFEREIHENFGIRYPDHPWLKPVRFPFNRANHQST